LYIRQVGLGSFETGVAFQSNVHLQLQAACWSKYQIKSRLTAHYQPQASSSVGARFFFAYTQDPCNPIYGYSNTSSGIPGANTAEGTPSSVFFPAWSSWSRSFETDTKTVFDMAGPPPVYQITGADVTPQFGLRHTDFGAISMGVDNGVQGAGQIRGRLFLEFTIEFSDPSPNVFNNIGNFSAISPILTTLHEDPFELSSLRPASLLRTADHRHVESKDEKDAADFVDLDPPRMTRTRPSGISPGFVYEESPTPPLTGTPRVPSRK
jgi:hypothetical protein